MMEIAMLHHLLCALLCSAVPCSALLICAMMERTHTFGTRTSTRPALH